MIIAGARRRLSRPPLWCAIVLHVFLVGLLALDGFWIWSNGPVV
jgi:hypothetical protein